MRVGIPVLLFLLSLLSRSALAQNHPELDWQVIETDHFRVLYHQGLAEAAQRAALIAEEAYGPVTQLYGYQPGGKVRILIKDYDDYANGAAYYYHDTIEIWATALDHDFELRGTTDWLGNVITHEFTHIISLGSALKAPQRMPAVYLQYFGYQREHNRPDVLVGYPDVLASYPVTTMSVPMWFAEGVAQYQALGARHDRWDSHRDMILRSAVLSDSLLSFDQMGVFGKCGFGNEFVYDHGYGLVRYIAQTYGDEKLAAICRAASGWKALEIGTAIHQALGLSADQLYQDWHQQLKTQYQAQVQNLGDLREGEVVVDRGFSNQRPVFSPEGKRLVYLSTRDRQFGPHALVLRQLDTGEEEVLESGVSSSYSWSPDGKKLVLVRHEQADKYGSRQADLYEYDLGVKERGLAGEIFWAVPGLVSDYARPSPQLKRLSHGLRALYPAYSPDGQRIAFVHNQGTHNNLGLMRADGTQIRYLTHFEDSTQLYTPQWSPDGQYLIFSIAREGARDIARLRVDQPEVPIEVLVATLGTDRDPVFAAGGGELIFASDFSGIFNLYTYDLKTQAIRPLTNVKGGAFSPTCSPSGEVAFAAYGARGFQIRKVGGEAGAALVPPAAPTPGPHPKAAPLSSHAYGVDFLKTSLIPRLLVDDGRFKGGLYVSSGDVLSRQNIFAGAAFAPANGDRDLFALYEYRGWRPTVFLEFNHQRRRSPRADSSQARDLVTTGVVYNLNQFNLGLEGNAGRHGEVVLSLTYDRYDASIASRYFDSQRIEWVKQKPYGYTYFQGFDLGLTYRFEALARRRDQEISPRGRQLYFRYDRLYNFYTKGFNQDVTFIDEEYLRLAYNQFTLDWNEHLPLPWGMALGLRFFGGLIANDQVDNEKEVDNFFDYHLGGIQYMKGYTYYSTQGSKVAMGNATLRFPILPDIHRRLLHLYFDKVYGAVYGDIGKAWPWEEDEFNSKFGRKGPLRDLGAQLRCDLFSYYSMPTRVQADLAYGVDEIAGKSPWKFYLTVLFGYL